MMSMNSLLRKTTQMSSFLAITHAIYLVLILFSFFILMTQHPQFLHFLSVTVTAHLYVHAFYSEYVLYNVYSLISPL